MKTKQLFILLLFIYSYCFGLTGAKYLIITPDNFVSTVQPLADWKIKKGVKTKIVPLSVTGSSASQIKNYIINAYNTWQIRPEYILLAGFGSVLPASGSSDDYYANISGSYRIELSIGRLPAGDVTTLNMLVAKILGYERNPYMDDATWFKKGVTVIREDNPPGTYYQTDCRYIRNLWQGAGFTQTESICDIYGHNSTNVHNAINNGRSFLVYRGQAVTNWWSPFNAVDPSSMTNGFKLPVVVSGTCVTLSLTSTGYYADRFMNCGTATNPKCAVAYFGTTGIGNSLPRSLVTKGFFKSLFEERTYVLGDVTKRAKFIMDSLYADQTRYAEWNLFGDPEMNLWTNTPTRMLVSYDTLIYSLPQIFNVLVRDASGSALANARVCLMMDTLIYQTVVTNISGIASFNIAPPVTGTMFVTVTGQNLKPYEGSVSIRPSSLNHDIGILSIVAPQGTISLGETITPRVKVKNYGANTDTFQTTLSIGSVYNQTDSFQILSPGDTNIIPLPSWITTTGTDQVTAFITLNNDQYHANDTAHTIINVVSPRDVGVDAILSPDSSLMLNQTVSPRARIKNYGSVTQTNFTAVCSIIGANNNIRYTNTQTINLLSAGDTAIVNFSNWTPTIAEVCTVKIRTNLVGDQNQNNDAQTKLITILMSIINEGFNDFSFPPAGWQAVIGNGTYNWERFTAGTDPTCTPYEGTGMAGYRSYSATDGNWARLISPAFTLSATTSCSLKFHMTLSSGWPNDPDSIIIEKSTNGTTFTQVAGFTRLSTAFAWVEQSVFLGNLSAGTNYIAFKALSSYGDNMFIDYIRLFAPASINEERTNILNSITQTMLYAPKPNPVINRLAHISYAISTPANVALRIYNVSGSLIKTLFNGFQNNGVYNITWDGKDQTNRQVADGIYFCTLETSEQKYTKKLILTR